MGLSQDQLFLFYKIMIDADEGDLEAIKVIIDTIMLPKVRGEKGAL